MLRLQNPGKLALSFQVNQGQSAPDVRFLAKGSGYTLYLTPTEAAGNAYITGLTNSSGQSSPPGFPTLNPLQANNNGLHDAFVLKITEGSRRNGLLSWLLARSLIGGGGPNRKRRNRGVNLAILHGNDEP